MRGGGALIILGGAAVAYYLYTKGYFSHLGTTTGTTTGGTSTGGTSTGGTSTGGSTTGTTGGGTSTSTGGSTSQLAAIYNRIASQSGITASTLFNPDQWDYYFNQFGGVSFQAPDPLVVFPGYDRSNPMQLTLSQWWAVMAPYLTANNGITGLSGWRNPLAV